MPDRDTYGRVASCVRPTWPYDGLEHGTPDLHRIFRRKF